jgi:hypothetical protein
MKWGHGHRAIPEFGIADPFHSNGKSRNVKMDNMAVQDVISSTIFRP